MASSFPGAIDSFVDPLSTSPLLSPSHSAQHADLNDAAKKIETYMGLVKVVPTSVSAGNTLSTDGTVTIGSAQTAVSINGCFSSLYDNYRVLVRIADSSGANDCYLRFRVGGSDDTNSVYNWFYVGLTSANVSLNSNAQGQTFAFTGTTVTATAFASRFEFDVMSPFIAEETRTYGLGYSRAPGGFRVGGAHHTNSTSFDGFTIFPSANNWTGGTIRVYGYRN